MAAHLRRLAVGREAGAYHLCYFGNRWSGGLLADAHPGRRVGLAMEHTVEGLREQLGDNWHGILIVPPEVKRVMKKPTKVGEWTLTDF